MKQELIHTLNTQLEKLTHRDVETNTEFWLARDLQSVFGYVRWANFERLIQKAMMTGKAAGYAVGDHFLRIDKIEDLPPKRTRKITDYALTRYACYLVAQSADAANEQVALARSYFAFPISELEIFEGRMADQERIEARRKLSESEKVLSGLIYEHVEDDEGFHRIRTKGDQALFGGVTTRKMKRRLRVPKGRAMADFLPTLTIKAKDFANEITNFGIKRDYLHTEAQITREYIKNNREIRKLLGRRKIKPEELPAAEDVKKVERRLLKNSSASSGEGKLISPPQQQLTFDPAGNSLTHVVVGISPQMTQISADSGG